MSLIQQALDKTNKVQETRTVNPSPKAYDRDPMGVALEQELTQVQRSYAARRRLYWKVSLGILAICFLAGLSYLGLRSTPARGKVSSSVATVTSHAPLRIFSGTLYRLTGITSINGKSMAVINEDIVSVGDSLSGKAIVKAIGPGEVRLDVQGREIKLTL